MNRFYFIITMICLWTVELSAQSRTAYLDAADDAFQEADYFSAFTYYNEALEFDSSNVYVNYHAAQSARLFNAYGKAEYFYSRTMDLDETNKYPHSGFWLAHSKQKLGNYADAKQAYEMYLSEYQGDDPYITARAEKEIKACEWAIGLEDNPMNHIELTRLGDGINTDKSEFGAVHEEEGLYFSSLRFEEIHNKKRPKKLISKILLSDDDVEADTLSSEISKDDLFIGHTAFNAAHTKMYYTQCEYFNGVNIRCDLYAADVTGINQFNNPTKLNTPINQDSVTTTQPAIGINPNSGEERLYFVSDRAGGKGQLDIWYADIDATGSLSEPQNLMDINTAENDITPYYHEATRMLFFSSEGYQSLGGYDVFKVKWTESGWNVPIHLGVPTNSSYHDVYYTLSDDAKTAYFSTNRSESRFIDEPIEACCYDIFRADIEELELILNALTFEKNSLDSLKGATVKVYDKDTGELLEEFTNLEDIHHQFKLEPDREYVVIGEKDRYTSDTIEINTIGKYSDELITKKLFLELYEIELDLTVFDKETAEDLEGAKVTIIDLTDPNAEDIVIENPDDNKFNVKLIPGHNYKIVIEREGYKPETIIIDENTKLDDGLLKKEVFLEKKDLNIFLPALLYFDNDRPNPKTIVTTTEKNYTDTYHPYLDRKPIFVGRAGRNLSSTDKVFEQQRVDDFFEFDVKGGYNKLYMFLNAVEEKINSGYSFEILIKGFASPLSTDKYNQALSKRRIASVRNELAKFKGGVLIPFMNDGKLMLTDVSYGEELAPQDVSDSARNQTKSVYSVEASRERRVELIKIRSIYNQ